MSGVADLGPVPTRFPADVELVRRLIAAQFPQWADLPIRPVEDEGWDNRTFHLGGDMSVRLPSAEPYALAVAKEHRWLPVLASQLPLPVPVPLAKGEPAESYPHAWSVYRWLPGRPADRNNIADLTWFAADLATFLVALQRIDADGGPGPGLHNWYRGGPLTTYDEETRRSLAVLEDHIRTDIAREIWQSALDAGWDGRKVWLHGDVAVGNLLVRDGALAAVIDFGTCGVGDPACDLAIGWTLFDKESRTAFLESLGADSATIARGRGWALWKALAGYSSDVRSGERPRPEVRYTLGQILSE